MRIGFFISVFLRAFTISNVELIIGFVLFLFFDSIALNEVFWIVGPSAIGSLNGIPISKISIF